MANAEFPSNSKQVVSRKEIKQVTKGPVRKKKKTLGTQFRDTFSAEEFKSAASYIFIDVVVPACKNLIVDATTKGIQKIIYGETGGSRNFGYTDPRTQRTVYHSTTVKHPAMRQQSTKYQTRRSSGTSETDIILATRAEAEAVISRMTDISDMYDSVSVADLYELVGLKASHVDNRWGWSGLHDVSIRQVREGYLIDLPSAEPL